MNELQLDAGKSYSLEEALDILTRSPLANDDGGHSPSDGDAAAKSLDDLYNLCKVALDETIVTRIAVLTSTDDLGKDETNPHNCLLESMICYFNHIVPQEYHTTSHSRI